MREKSCEELAVNGGAPVRTNKLPYGKQSVSDDDLEAVTDVLRSDFLTTGPKVNEFEKEFARYVGAKEAVALSNGTAALHAAVYALGVGEGDEVIVPTLTFAASANCVIFQGAKPVLVDVDPVRGLIDLQSVRKAITTRTKAIISVDYAGHPCDYDALRSIAKEHSLYLIADACHAVGALYKGKSVGSLADLSAFSFHPVKHMTCGEGGMVTTDNVDLAKKMRNFRNHGITTDFRERQKEKTWAYEMTSLGYNYRLTDFQCALGLSQLKKVGKWIDRRQYIAFRYDEAFNNIQAITPLVAEKDVSHAYHLYVIKIDPERVKVSREEIFKALHAEGIGVNVHYIPVHSHPYYREKFGYQEKDFPVSMAMYSKILSLPIFPGMSDSDIDDVIEAVRKVFEYYTK